MGVVEGVASEYGAASCGHFSLYDGVVEDGKLWPGKGFSPHQQDLQGGWMCHHYPWGEGQTCFTQSVH